MTGRCTAVIATMAGYGFARFRFRGAGVVFALVLVTMMMPFQALLTPLFLELHTLGLTNNLIGLALFYTTFNLPFGVFVMRNTFLQIPWELCEEAAVDGASATRTLVSVLRAGGAGHRDHRAVRVLLLLDGVRRSADVHVQQ